MAAALSVEHEAILWPMLALAALTFAVAGRMYARRIAEMRARRIAPQSIASRQAAAERLEDTAAADNFANLFELPVLFHVLCLALYVTENVTMPQLVLAWVFVALRIAHSAIHCTYNRVMHRFQVFVLGMLCLLAMWVLFGLQLAG
jgi:hypothetical protein